MAYDQYQAERIYQSLKSKQIKYTERKMMGGLCIMVDDKMCFGLLKDKQTNEDILMIRVGEEQYSKIINDNSVAPMNFTGRPMKGYAFVRSEGFDMDDDLDKWIQLCLNFNPAARSSKKKKG